MKKVVDNFVALYIVDVMSETFNVTYANYSVVIVYVMTYLPDKSPTATGTCSLPSSTKRLVAKEKRI